MIRRDVLNALHSRATPYVCCQCRHRLLSTSSQAQTSSKKGTSRTNTPEIDIILGAAEQGKRGAIKRRARTLTRPATESESKKRPAKTFPNELTSHNRSKGVSGDVKGIRGQLEKEIQRAAEEHDSEEIYAALRQLLRESELRKARSSTETKAPKGKKGNYRAQDDDPAGKDIAKVREVQKHFLKDPADENKVISKFEKKPIQKHKLHKIAEGKIAKAVAQVGDHRDGSPIGTGKGETITALKQKLLATVTGLSAESLKLTPIDIDIAREVPQLEHGLDRVLFNPGVTLLQDPRSRVYNFDPYLQNIMSVTDFDFDALTEYITSSKDTTLENIARDSGLKYVGSTSSMTAALSHFHYLLSNWRKLNMRMLSKEFSSESVTFTNITKAPASIILRWKNGVYAIDADKEFDTETVLTMLGRSMEKLLTLPASVFERYRKGHIEGVAEEALKQPEAYHYTTFGTMLMRSQLDAKDDRLPGSGVFDLKTRAVAGIRHDIHNSSVGAGYQIRKHIGDWESFEREYHDMVRATFLKYSLQVRIGRMDGIFVAYHNTQRIFGFQYVPLEEMDRVLHGNSQVAAQEFKFSLKLFNEALDHATARFPEQTLRIHFECREGVKPFMYITAEPITDEDLDKAAEQKKAQAEAFWAGITKNTTEGTDEEPVSGYGSLHENTDVHDTDSVVHPGSEHMQSSNDMIEQEVESVSLDAREQAGHLESSSTGDVTETNRLHADRHDRSSVLTDTSNVMSDDKVYDTRATESYDSNSGTIETELVPGAVNHSQVSTTPENSHTEDVDQEFNNTRVNNTHGADTNLQTNDILFGTENGTPIGQVETQGAATQDTSRKEDAARTSLNISDSAAEEDLNSGNFKLMARYQRMLRKLRGDVDNTDNAETSALNSPEEADDQDEDVEEDLSYLSLVTNESPSTQETDDIPEDFYFMTLFASSKIDGVSTPRPMSLTEDQDWTIDYDFTENTVEESKRKFYKMIRARRHRVFTRDEEGQVSAYVQNLIDLSNKGRVWLEKRLEEDKDKPVVVYERRDSLSSKVDGN